MAGAERDPDDGGPAWAATWADAVDGMTRALQVGADLQRRVTRSTLSSFDVGAGSVRGAQEQWRRYATQVTELTIDYYRAVARAARDYGEGLAADRSADRGSELEHEHHDGPASGRDPLRETRQTARPEPAGPVVELRGRSGSVLATSFVVENRDPDPASVAVTPGLARAPDGERFVAPLSVDPAALTIPPGGSADVHLRVPLLAEVFEPDVRYRIPLRVDGPRPTTVEVIVVAERALDAPAEPEPEAAPVADNTSHAAADDAAADAAGDDDAAADAQPAGYTVRCPACERTFQRTTTDLRLRPHKTPDGAGCPERDARRVRRR